MQTHARFLFMLAALAAPLAATAVPMQFSHQGRMMDALGAPLTSTEDVTFNIYDTPAGGTPMHSETISVSFDEGYYAVEIGAGTPLDADDFLDDPVYLGITVGTGSPELPRLQLNSVPYALVAESVVGAVDASSLSVGGTDITDGSGTIIAPIDWTQTNTPTDGTLAGLGCSSAASVPLFDGSTWGCAAANDHNHDASDISGGILNIARIPVGTDSNSVAAGNHDHGQQLEGLGCSDGEIARFNASNSQWECATPSAGGGVMIAQFELDETTGATFADTSGLGNNATAPTGGIAVGSGGHTGNAIAFSGGVIAVPAGNTIPDSPQVWVEAWLQPQAPISGTKTIAEKRGAWEFQQVDGGVSMTVHTANGDCTVTSGPKASAGVWMHAAGWYDGLEVVTSIDGITATADCTNGPLTASAGGALNIGASYDGSTVSSDYVGRIDELRVRSIAPAFEQSHRRAQYFRYAGRDGNEYNGWTNLGYINFTAKKYDPDSLLKITWTDNYRVISPANNGGVCGWRLLINGANCAPNWLLHMQHNTGSSPSSDTHQTATTVQICEGVPAGDVVLQGQSRRRDGDEDCYRGYGGDLGNSGGNFPALIVVEEL